MFFDFFRVAGVATSLAHLVFFAWLAFFSIVVVDDFKRDSFTSALRNMATDVVLLGLFAWSASTVFWFWRVM